MDSDEEEHSLALLRDIPRLELRRPTVDSPNNAQIIDEELCSSDLARLIEEEAEEIDLDPIHQAITSSFSKIQMTLAAGHDQALKVIKKCMDDVCQKEKAIRDLQKQVAILEQGHRVSRGGAMPSSAFLQAPNGSHLRRPTPSHTIQSRRSWRAPSRANEPKRSLGATLGNKVSEFRMMISRGSAPAAGTQDEGDVFLRPERDMSLSSAASQRGGGEMSFLGLEAEKALSPSGPEAVITRVSSDESMTWSSSGKQSMVGDVPQAPCASRKPQKDVQAPVESAPALKLPCSERDTRDEGAFSAAASHMSSRRPSPIPPEGTSEKPADPNARRPSLSSKASLKSAGSEESHRLEILPQWEKEVKQRPKKSMRSLARASTQDSLASTASMSSSEVDTYGCRCCSLLMLDPNSTVRASWDIGSVVLVLYDMVMIPLQLFDIEENFLIRFFTWTTRFFWTFDIYMSFMTGVLKKNGLIEYRFNKIAKNYITTWFAVDFLIVATDWVEVIWSEGNVLGFARAGKASRTFRIIRMVRLLRLARIKNIMHAMFERIESEQLSILAGIVGIMCGIVSLSHIIACVWYGLATEDRPDTWLRVHNFADASVELKYTTALHWSLLQFAGGTDEIVPQNVGERVYAVGVFILAFVLASIFVGRLTSSMTQLHMLTKRDTEKFQVLKRYLTKNEISSALAMRVIHNAQHSLDETKRFMEEAQVELLSMISEPLRVELHFELYAPVLNVHPFFSLFIEACPQVVKKVCHTAMSQLLVSAGDVVFMPGEVPHPPQMFIVCSGELSYHNMSGSLAYIEAGQWLSEATLWTNWIHQGMLKAASDCRLVRLDALKFVHLAEHFDVDFDIRSYARTFLACMNQGTMEISDLPFTEESEELLKVIAKLERPKLDPFAVEGEIHVQTVMPDVKRTSCNSALSPVSNHSSQETPKSNRSVLNRKSSVLMVTPTSPTTPKRRWPWG